jgi:peptidoglycan/xylan/chitin deacetylase (PgdA/CDA1 family)
MRASVLTYHSGNIAGNDYGDNNLVALAHDLEQIHALKLDIVPLRHVVDALLGASPRDLPDRVVAITLDDGLDFDFVDLVHPFHGSQVSVDTILRQFSERFGVAVHATSFVIASPEARRQIAKRGMLDHQWIGDEWWSDAVASGRFHVANHSWDHLSPLVDAVAQREGKTGSFALVDRFEDADVQIRVAREFIESKAPNPGSAIFAYPYGDAADYVVNEYLPVHGVRHCTLAAVSGTPGTLHAGSNRWLLPRYTCGTDWRTPEELNRILRA